MVADLPITTYIYICPKGGNDTAIVQPVIFTISREQTSVVIVEWLCQRYQTISADLVSRNDNVRNVDATTIFTTSILTYAL